MRVLIACEFSGRVRDAFRERGHDAWSCDTEPTDADPAFHYQCDVFEVIGQDWDMMVAFPPCTYLSCVSGNLWHLPERKGRQLAALGFAWALMNAAHIPRIAVENPVGRINTAIRKPDQIINPYQFGDPWRKRTCLWLKNLPPLEPTNTVEPVGYWISSGTHYRRGNHKTSIVRNGTSRENSLTFSGIAEAMAGQWGNCGEYALAA